LRKYLIAAVAATTALAVATAAPAQAPTGATLDVTIAPAKAGTKKKPKAASIKLKIVNANPKRTASKLEIWIAKTVKVNTKGVKTCNAVKLEADGKDACPAKSNIGSGIANARAGVNTPSGGTPLVFNVTAFLTGKKSMVFYLEQKGGAIKVGAPATLSKASGKFGSKLTVDIPQLAREFPPGVFNGLQDLETTLKSKKGQPRLVTTVGCKNKKHPFKATVTFQPNPDPANAGTESDTDDAPCS
jgi:hypothetical protein